MSPRVKVIGALSFLSEYRSEENGIQKTERNEEGEGDEFAIVTKLQLLAF